MSALNATLGALKLAGWTPAWDGHPARQCYAAVCNPHWQTCRNTRCRRLPSLALLLWEHLAWRGCDAGFWGVSLIACTVTGDGDVTGLSSMWEWRLNTTGAKDGVGHRRCGTGLPICHGEQEPLFTAPVKGDDG